VLLTLQNVGMHMLLLLRLILLIYNTAYLKRILDLIDFYKVVPYFASYKLEVLVKAKVPIACFLLDADIVCTCTILRGFQRL
jgi:hypothetical protein